MAECRGLAPLARGHALVSTEARLACPVGIPNWSAWGDLHSQGCSVLSRIGLLFPINHTPIQKFQNPSTKFQRSSNLQSRNRNATPLSCRSLGKHGDAN